MIKWAGRIVVFVGAGHTLLSLALTSPHYAGRWLSGTLWRSHEGIDPMSRAMAGFWLTTGSLGVPLTVIGVMVLWLDRRGILPPPFIAWTLGIWAVVFSVILGPSPMVLLWLAVGLLVAGTRRAARHGEPALELGRAA